MAEVEWVNVWFDKAWHHLDVMWASKVGNFFTPTENDRVWVLVNKDGDISGFKVWGVHKIKDGEVTGVELTPAALPQAQPEPAATV